MFGFFCPCHEITERVVEARHARLRAELTERLHALAAPDEIMGAAAEALGRHLGVATVGYAEMAPDEDMILVGGQYGDGRMPEAAGWRHVSDFGAVLRDALRAGEALFIDDIAADPHGPEGGSAASEAMALRAAAVVPLVRDGRPVATLYALDPEPRPWSEPERTPLRDVAERTWAAVERGRAEAALAESERRLRALVDGIPELVWRSRAGGHLTWASPQSTAFTGQSDEDSRDRGWLDALRPDDREGALAAWAAADHHLPFEAEYRVLHAASGRHRWCQTRATPVRGGAGDNVKGSPVEWVGVTTDVHELRELHERQGVMVAEPQHRTRNLIAVVMAIANQTRRRAASLEEFGERFGERLEALSRVQGLLSQAGGRAVPIGTLVRLELDALGVEPGSGRVRVEGPEASLSGASVQTMVLAIHELATNAREHGALAAEGGRPAVVRRVRGGGGDAPLRLALDWIEGGVIPPAGTAPPDRQGYGRHLIERALPRALGATTSFALGPDGARCAVELSIDPTRATAP